MYIFKLSFLFIFLFSLNGGAQNNGVDFDLKAKSISDLDDINEKKYQLTEFASAFANYLEQNVVTIAAGEDSYIKTTNSSDSKYTLYYFNTFANGIIYRIDWFVLYGDIDRRKVLHGFDDQVSKQVKKGNGELELHLARQQHKQLYLYPLTFSFKEDKKTYKEYRDVAVICYFEELMQRKTEAERLSLNDSILHRMQILWENPELFTDNFNGIKRMSTLLSEDGKVKVCTWNLVLPNSTNNFYGAVVVKTKNGVKVSPLNDNTDKIRSPERSSLTNKSWYGAIYYDMVQVKDKNKRVYYLLLGYKPNNEMTKKKVVETLMVVGNGQVRFGHSVFRENRYLYKRLVFEYGAAANMMLQYDKENQRIVLDHLAPPNSMYIQNKRFYGPDFSYDAYVFDKEKWVLVKDVDVFNPTITQ
ncbi:hypothetical protein SAMN06265379_106105 [Saccharicrinis carchari]|uniref:Uncharacterized protein n=1 Tax=Saccharicrinis carchari TaxID=1168039 RepID=A0A521DRP8_SACCC|nr:hypothetical protein [Saccharicrinis carchari]SMO74374.1 hypothetical protein SAMN06265379_106105 [Saccharicrinis carchari]